jgi:Spy/CpxP family protein refolding chaperone
MTKPRTAVILAGALALALAVVGTAAQVAGSSGKGAAPQSPAPCACAPYTTVTGIGTNMVHCQCGPATCVVSEHITGQAKSYALQCVK